MAIAKRRNSFCYRQKLYLKVKFYETNSLLTLTDYTDRQGRRFKYEYDGQGRLRSVVKSDGARINVDRDERGHVRRIVPATASNTTSTRGRLLSHAPVQVDMDDPNIEWGDPLVIEAWAQRWKDLPLSGGLIGNGNNLSDNSGSIDGSSDGIETYEHCKARIQAGCDKDYNDKVKTILFVAGGTLLVEAVATYLVAGATGLETLGIGSVISIITGAGIMFATAIVAAGAWVDAKNGQVSCLNGAYDLCKYQPGAPSSPPQ